MLSAGAPVAHPAPPMSLDVAQITKPLHAALRSYHAPTSSEGSVFATFVSLQRLFQDLVTDQAAPTARRQALNRLIDTGLELLARQEPRSAELLSLRFVKRHKLAQVMRRLDLGPDQMNRAQRAAIGHLAGVLVRLEDDVREAAIQRMESRLTQVAPWGLVGLQMVTQRLMAQLQSTAAPWVVVICGLGGIGKTTLAESVTRQSIRELRYQDVIWVRWPRMTWPGEVDLLDLALELAARTNADPEDPPASRAQLLQRLRLALRARPHLVVFDNLEEDRETTGLIDALTGLGGPSRFLLTTRARPDVSHSAAFLLSLSELGLVDSLSLLKQHAHQTGLTMASDLSDAEGEAIYRVVGGNPFALKLVLGLTEVQPLAAILDDLKHQATGATDALFQRIYRRAWEALSSDARNLLRVMPLIADEGARPDYLQALSGLEGNRLWPAVSELWVRSLLEVRGTLHDKRYGIHRLTETFVRNDVIGWAPQVGAP
jgi:hypothetical protein